MVDVIQTPSVHTTHQAMLLCVRARQDTLTLVQHPTLRALVSFQLTQEFSEVVVISLVSSYVRCVSGHEWWM